jgi:hypothetical protein
MTQVCEDNLKTVISVLASGFLVISEILPYLKFIKGNGILDAISQALKKHQIDTSDELDNERRLLQDAI